MTKFSQGRPIRLALMSAVILTFLAASAPTVIAAGNQVPSGCDKTLDIYRSPYLEGDPNSFYGTCWTARTATHGYTASGLTAWVQATLAGHGYSLTIDGYFGPITETKVKQWQAAKGLASDGIVGYNTWTTLDLWGSPQWVVVAGTCHSAYGLRFYKTNGASGTKYAAMACWTGGVGSGSRYLAYGDFCVKNASDVYVEANHVDPANWSTYGDCRDYFDA